MSKPYKPRWKLLEQEFLLPHVKRECLDFDWGKIYYLTHKESVVQTSESNVVIGLHGTAGTAMGFQCLSLHFSPGTRFYFIELPGFGKSYHNQQSLLQTSQEHVQLLVRVVIECMNKLNIPQARFVAHSFGCVVTIELAYLYAERVQNLTLVSPAGLLPTLDYCAWWYGMLFKIRFPYFLKYFRTIIQFIFWIRFKMFTYLKTTFGITDWGSIFGGRFRKGLYLLCCYSDQKAKGGDIVASFVTCTWKCSNYWNYPLLDKLLCVSQPISMIYGERDNLTPSHQGLIAQGIHPHIQIEILPGEGHIPIESFSQLVVDQIQHNTTSARKIYPKLALAVQDVIYSFDKYYGSILFSSTRKRFLKLYTRLLQVYRECVD